MTLGSAGIWILVGVGVGLIGGLVVTLIQIGREPRGWSLLSHKPVEKVSGWRSSVAVMILGFALLLLGSVLSQNSVVLALGAVCLAFGGIRYVFRYYRPAL